MDAPVPLSAWRAETLRLTLFTVEPLPVAELNWWESVVGEPPESRNLRPRVGRLEEAGRVRRGSCNLALDCQAQRVDWLMTPVLPEDQELTDFPNLGPFSEALGLFRELLAPWLKSAPPSDRLAFGAVLLYPVDSREAGYRVLGGLLPFVTLDPEGSSDFNYSINRPRVSRVGLPGLRINRLSKWAVARLTGIMFGSQKGLPTVRPYKPGFELNACRVELDINTAPDLAGELAGEGLVSVSEELIDLGCEIASSGDVP